MSKTLLLFNGQPVILTNDGADSVVEGGSPLTASHREVKILPDMVVGQQQQEEAGQSEGLKPSVLQVKVHGREVPGFVVSQESGTAVHKVLGQSLHLKKEFELLGPAVEENHETSAKRNPVSEGGFLQLPVGPLHGTAGLEEQQGGGLAGEMFTITTGTQLLQQTSQVKDGCCDREASSGGSSGGNAHDLQGLGNLVQLPMVAEVKGQVEGTRQEEGQDNGQTRNLSTLVAIIQGEDGTTQTIELPQEEACRLALPQLLSGGASLQPLDDSHLVAKIGTEQGQNNHHLREVMEADRTPLTKECPPVFSEGQAGTLAGREVVDVEGEEADVSLGPFLLIPEYNSDGTISTVLQIRGSETEAVSETATACAQQHSANVSFIDTKKPPVTFSRPSQNVQKIRLPLAPQVTQATATAPAPKRQSCLRAKAPEWRAVAVAPRTAPKVSGNTYLRDIAKRTKFRNLTSLLEGKQDTEVSDESSATTTITTTTTSTTTTTRLVGTPVGVGGDSSNSLLTHEPVKDSPRPFSVASGCSLLRPASSSISSRAVPGASGAILHLPRLPPAPKPASPPPGQAGQAAGSTLLQEVSASIPRDRTLTIRVNTGPINTTTTTVTPTTTSTTTQPPPPLPPPPPPISTPGPSIKCADYTEVTDSNTLTASDSTSLTSIVYCSSGGDETPFTVHLPGGDSSKPLGSSENPIQLVQQGNTFQALQPVQERQLEQITALLQQRRITAPPTSHHDEIYDPKTNMKIVYKVVYPEDVLPEEDDDDDDDDDLSHFVREEEGSWEAQTTFLEEKRRGRKPKDWRKLRSLPEELLEEDVTEDNEEKKKPLSRTRSGRISRPPRHMIKDFKHLHPVNFNDDAKEKDTTSFGYLDYDDYVPPEAEKMPEPIIADLPRRKKRAVPPQTRLRYTCATCGKLYMGRIEAHYRKFPDHYRKLPPSPTDPKQSYSTIKTLSDPTKPSGGEGSEINKSVLSPTPGTPATENSGEPGLPMETLTAQPHHQLEPQPTQDLPVVKLEPSEPQLTPTRARRGRGRRKGRARRGGRGRPGRVAAPSMSVVSSAPSMAPVSSTPTITTTSTPTTSPINVLEKILSVYTSEDIQNAVGHRLFQDLSPWKMLCLRSDRDDSWPQWQDRLRFLEDLLRECREEFHSQTEPLSRPTCEEEEESLYGGDRRGCGESVSGNGASQPASCGQDVLSYRDTAGDGDSNSCTAVKKEESSNFQVPDYLADILGATSSEYQLKRPSSSSPAPALDPSPVPQPHSFLPQPDIPPPLVNFSSGKRFLEDKGNEDAESPPKKRETEPEGLINKTTATVTTIAAPLATDITAAIPTDTGTDISHKKSEYSNSINCVNSGGIDCVSSALEAATRSLELTPYALPSQLSPEGSTNHPSVPVPVLTESTPSLLSTVTESNTQLAVALPHLSECVAVSGSTTLTTAHTPPPCSTPTSSLSLEIPSFSTHSTSPPTLPPCLPLTSMDTTFIPTSTMPQVNTMQQMPLGDMDITAEDLPRLLSEGTGLVVGGSGDGCDAPKLLDTSGDTTDLSEMLFKLQEATASISQSQENNLSSQMYQENINGSAPQLLTPQGLHTPVVSLTGQDYSTVGSSLNPHPTTSLGLKLDTSQASGEPTMPLLTFSGALNSDFHSNSGLGHAVSRSEESNKINAILCEVSSHLERTETGQNRSVKDGGERLNIGYGTTNLGMSDFEDLLKR